jgi:hypothetical protein
MHHLNTPDVVGHHFYAKPNNASSTSIDYLYNTLYGQIPTRLDFSDKYDSSCLQVLNERFDPFTCILTKVDNKVIEEGVWIGKEGTPYEQVIIGVYFKSSDGLGLRNSGFGSIDLDKDFVKNMYVTVKAVTRDRAQANQLSALFDQHILTQVSKIYVLVNTYGDLGLSALPMDAVVPDMCLNYGEEFEQTNKFIVDSLNGSPSGLYLFHGSPGTGKSTYIKYLCSGVLNRKIAYIPVGLINHLTSPEMLPLLLEHKDLILVVEDAEKALVSRETSDNSQLVSQILNLTDGFLGSAMNVSIVATFNTGKENIDEALLRKGRLKVCHEFKKLSASQAKTLAKSLGKNYSSIDQEMSLADVYYMEDSGTNYGKEETRRVGFR